ncbi:MAG: hypothetical protein JW864_06895 [Spirochaetes bacterium]|nr:hypothetical protein [Spirochaetota bacterium]
MTLKRTDNTNNNITPKQLRALQEKRELLEKVKNSILDSSKNKRDIDENIEFLLNRF